MIDAPNPFLQLTPPRVKNALSTLKELLWEDIRPVEVRYAGASPQAIPLSKAKNLDFTSISLPFAWGQLFQTGWFHLRFPETSAGETRWLRWQDQGEGTLFLNDAPWYGFDVAHRFARLPEGATEGWIEGLCLQSAIWHHEATGTTPEGSLLSGATTASRNEDVWSALHDLEVFWDLAKDEASPSPEFGGLQQLGSGYRREIQMVSVLLRRLLRVLDDAVNALDRDGVRGMLSVFDQARPLLKQSPVPIQAVLTGHAHIDLVWLWPERCGEYKARHTFASMNRLLEEYPEFRFAYSQSASYEAVARTCPELHALVKQRVEQGLWEAVGASYVEMDTLVACGEALARAFLVGQDVFRDLFGHSSGTLWLPDVFGYSGCLPQIMRQCGVDNFFTTKLTWSNINRFPHSSFVWRGIDGSEVLTHVTQELGYNQNATPTEGRAAARAHLQADVHDAFLQPTGFGDGGGGVTPEMCERARRMASLTNVPQTRWGRIDDFFADLEKARDRLPRHQGELYLEYHRGTFTTHGDLKAAFRGLERALQVQEAAHALDGAGPVDVHAWKRLIFSQFHDYIPGSSIREVYVEGLPELRELAAKALDAARKRLGEGSLVFNPLPLPRPHAVTHNGEPARVTLPPLSVSDPTTLSTQSLPTATADAKGIRGGRVEADFNERGEVTRLVADGRAVPLRAPLNQFWIYPDKPHHYPAWDIDRQTLSLGKHFDAPAEPVARELPPGSAGVSFRRKISDQSWMVVHYTVDGLHPVLNGEVEVEWNERDTLLKAHFPTEHEGRFARFGAPYGSVLRGQHPGDPRDEAMFEACASRWAVVMDDNQHEGLALVTRDKYGMGCRQGNLHLSVLRSARVTGDDIGHGRMFPEANRPLSPRESHSDLGRHAVRYALAPWRADLPREEQPATLADLLHTPALPAGGDPRQAGFLGLTGGESLVPAWAKPLKDGGWILRIHETLGRAGQAEVSLTPGWRATRTRLAEDLAEPVEGPFTFRPYEIVSLEIRAV